MKNDYPISPSALATASKCGWAHKYSKVQRLRSPSKGAVLLLGTVFHKALEWWAHDRSQDLVGLMARAWRETAAGTPLERVVKAYEKLNAEAQKLQQDILWDRPEIKAVTRTKDWKESETAKKLNKFDATHKPWLDKDEYDWEDRRFSESYTETMRHAESYQTLYRDKDPALLTEVGFTVEVAGVKLRGFIDAVELYINEDGEPVAYDVIDYKTYTSEPDPLKDFVQLMTYYVAATQNLPQWLEDAGFAHIEGLPIRVGLDLTHLQERQLYQPEPHHIHTFLEICRDYMKWRDNEVYLPNFKGKCDWCEWKAQCDATLRWSPIAA